jgi:hypothetical protein
MPPMSSLNLRKQPHDGDEPAEQYAKGVPPDERDMVRTHAQRQHQTDDGVDGGAKQEGSAHPEPANGSRQGIVERRDRATCAALTGFLVADKHLGEYRQEGVSPIGAPPSAVRGAGDGRGIAPRR